MFGLKFNFWGIVNILIFLRSLIQQMAGNQNWPERRMLQSCPYAFLPQLLAAAAVVVAHSFSASRLCCLRRVVVSQISRSARFEIALSFNSCFSPMPNSAIPSLCLTPEQKELLIDAVEARPAIWDQHNEQYSDNNLRRQAYAEVAQVLSDQSGSHYKPAEMQIEFKKMRDVFNRTLKKVIAAGGKCDEIAWRYWDRMKFIASPEQLAQLRYSYLLWLLIGV
jgi:hypothetical protein